jgi:hypothetical protein
MTAPGFVRASFAARREFATHRSLEAYLTGCRAEIEQLEILLRWDSTHGQQGACLEVIASFVDGVVLTDPKLAASICAGACLALVPGEAV